RASAGGQRFPRRARRLRARPAPRGGRRHRRIQAAAGRGACVEGGVPRGGARGAGGDAPPAAAGGGGGRRRSRGRPRGGGAAGVQGDRDRLARLYAELHPLSGASDREILAATRLAEQLIIAGRPELADQLLAGLEALAAELRDAWPALAGRVYGALAHRRRFGGDARAARGLVALGAECFERAGDHRNACLFRGRIGFSLLVIGKAAAAEQVLREVVAAADRMGLQNVAATARHNLGLTLSRLGRFDEARRVEMAARDAFRASGNRRLDRKSVV